MAEAAPPLATGDSSVRKILVATDRSTTASRAVGFAAEMASRYAAELVVLQAAAHSAAHAAAEVIVFHAATDTAALLALLLPIGHSILLQNVAVRRSSAHGDPETWR